MHPFSNAARTTLMRRLPVIRHSQTLQQRPFSVTLTSRVRHSGTSSEEFEQKKDEQIKKQKKGQGEWHETLASSSESHVKADQEKVKDHDDHIEKLQEETANAAEQEKGKK